MVERITASNEVSWIRLNDAAPEELAALVREAKLSPGDAEFIVNNHQRPDVFVMDGYVVLLIHVPVFDRETRVTSATPLYFVVCEKTVWTVQEESIPVLGKLWQDFNENDVKRDEYFSEGAMGLALHIADTVQAGSFKKLSRLSKHIDIAEDAIFHGHERQMVEEVSLLMRDVMDFRKIIRSQVALFATLPEHKFVTDELAVEWRRLNGQMRKSWDILEGLFESTKELEKTNSRLLQHKENELLRMLTYYSIFSIPALYIFQAVNPFASGVSSTMLILYWGLLGLLVVTLAVIFLRFKRKRVL